jgi:hypothetical protein
MTLEEAQRLVAAVYQEHLSRLKQVMENMRYRHREIRRSRQAFWRRALGRRATQKVLLRVAARPIKGIRISSSLPTLPSSFLDFAV